MVKKIDDIHELQWPAEQVAFMQDFASGTTTIPGSRSRLWNNTVEIEIETALLGLSLENIKATPSGKGHGKQAMEWLTTLANKHGVSIFADAVPEHISTADLKKWYEDCGFTRNGGMNMRYFPQ